VLLKLKFFPPFCLVAWLVACLCGALTQQAGCCKAQNGTFFSSIVKRHNKQTSDKIGGESLQIFHLLSLWVLQNKIAQASQSLNLS
jgi:hypothetical protein